MGIFSIFLLALAGIQALTGILPILTWSNELHHACLSVISFESEWLEVYRALLCGSKFEKFSRLKAVFLETGLMHLMVISGAHLLFLENMWSKMHVSSKWRWVILIVLTVYTITSGLRPPAVRAYFSYLLFQTSSSYKLFWHGSLVAYLSGIFCLLWQPSWFDSFSLYLSWTASLIMPLSRSQFVRAGLIYLFLSPILNHWNPLHPLTIFISWAGSMLIGSFLFPLSMLCLLIPGWHLMIDWLWAGLFSFLEFLSELIPQYHAGFFKLPKSWFWPYVSLGFVINICQLSWNKIRIMKKGIT